MTDLQSLRNTRKNLRRRVTELYTDRVNFDLLSPIEIKENIALLKSYREEILDLNSDIHDAILAQENDNVITEEEYVKCQEYKDRINKCMTRLREATGDDPPHNNEHGSRSITALSCLYCSRYLYKLLGNLFSKYVVHFSLKSEPLPRECWEYRIIQYSYCYTLSIVYSYFIIYL